MDADDGKRAKAADELTALTQDLGHVGHSVRPQGERNGHRVCGAASEVHLGRPHHPGSDARRARQ